jgi:3-carboxy-cis,cis-muconate cycloisomerase
VGGWHAEWPIVASVIQSTGLAAASMAELAEGLSVDPARMRQNLENTQGAIFAERAMMLLAPKLGRDVAHKLLEEASRASAAQGRYLSEVLAEMPEVTKCLDAAMLRQIEAPEQYLGSAEAFRKALLARVAESKKTERRKTESQKKEQ